MPEVRSMTLPLHVDDAVNVTVTPLRVVPSASSVVHSFPAESPAGSVVRKTSAHWLPSELLLAEGTAVAVAVAVAGTLAEVLGAAAEPLLLLVAALAIATPSPVRVSNEAAMSAPLPSVRLRMGFPFDEWADDASPWRPFL